MCCKDVKASQEAQAPLRAQVSFGMQIDAVKSRIDLVQDSLWAIPSHYGCPGGMLRVLKQIAANANAR